MINRRTLFKTLAAVGFGTVFTPKFSEAAALSPGLSFGRLPATLQPQQPSVQDPEGLIPNLMAIERWEDLIDDLDCVELVTRYDSLKDLSIHERASLDLTWKADCPFCNKSHTLRVGIDCYRCDNCKSTGSAIDFYSKMEGVPVAEAAFSLEAMLGSGELKGHRSLREYGWEIMAEAERFYHELLLECSGGAEAKRWLADQGISVKTIETFGIGYAPVRPSRLLSNHLLEQGYSFRALSGASVMRHDDGVLCDRFSGGLIPTRDQQRHCFGFIESLSSFPCISKNWLQRTTCISARRYRRLVLPPPSWPHDFNKFDAVLIVESPSEVLALHSAGIPNAVYLVGLEPFALRTALALAKTIIYPWQAERNASRPLEAIMDHIGHEYQRVKFLALPGGNSLTELLQQQGPEAVRTAIRAAIPLRQVLSS